MAKCVEELQVWQRARALTVAIFAITEVSAFRRHPRLADQLNDAADSLLSNIAEGFGQPSDRGFARYLGLARGSCNEVRSHLTVAIIRRCVTSEHAAASLGDADEISRMLTGLIDYLNRSDRRHRG